MKNLYFIISLGLIISACQPLYPEKQQQNNICLSMIQSYFKIQQHTEYKLWSIDMQHPQRIDYAYRPVTGNGMMIGSLKNRELNFQCIQNHMTFSLRLKSQQPFMQFELPKQKL